MEEEMIGTERRVDLGDIDPRRPSTSRRACPYPYSSRRLSSSIRYTTTTAKRRNIMKRHIAVAGIDVTVFEPIRAGSAAFL